jgi:hypothetical protein
MSPEALSSSIKPLGGENGRDGEALTFSADGARSQQKQADFETSSRCFQFNQRT